MPIYSPPDPNSMFKQNIAGQIAPFLAGAGQAVGQSMQTMKQEKLAKAPLWQALGLPDPASDEAKGDNSPYNNIPQGMRTMISMPVGHIHALSQAMGGSLQPFLNSGVNFWYDPKKQSFGVGAAPEGAVPIPGAKPAQVVAGLKKPGGQSWTPEQLDKVATRIQHGDYAYLKQTSNFGGGFKNALAMELANRGVDLTPMHMDFSARESYMKTVNSQSFQSTLKFLQSVRPNMDTLIKLSDKVGRTFSKPLNRGYLAAQAATGKGDVAAYAAAAVEVQDQIAKILQGGGTGNATSDNKLKQAQEVLSKDFTPQQMRDVTVMLKGMLNERENAMKTNTYLSFSNMKDAPKDPAKRYDEIKKANPKMTDMDIYKQMHKEGINP